MHHRNIKGLQVPARTDARQQQDLRRADGAGCEDHLAAAARRCGAALATVGDARCAAAIEDHPLGVRVCDDVEVGAFAGRVQIADRGAAAPAVLRRKLEVAGALLPTAVETLPRGAAEFADSLAEPVAQRAADAPVGHRQRPAAAAARSGPGLLDYRETPSQGRSGPY